MKGVILAAGKGNRMQPLTNTLPKCMLPVADKPILEWGISLFRDELNIKDILIIVGYKKEKIIEYFGKGEDFGVNINYITQDLEEIYGLGAALQLAENFVGDDFTLLLGDNLYKGPYSVIIDEHIKLKSQATLHIEEVIDPSRYGVVVKESENSKRIVNLLEKPSNPPSNNVVTGFYVLNKIIFDVLSNLPLSERGELELTDALNVLAKSHFVAGIKIDGWRKDFGYPIDLLDAARWYQDNNEVSIIESFIDESVHIINPVYIGKNCTIKDSSLGPYTTIGSNVTIINSRIIHSVILEGTIIEDQTIIDTVANCDEIIKLDV